MKWYRVSWLDDAWTIGRCLVWAKTEESAKRHVRKGWGLSANVRLTVRTLPESPKAGAIVQ